jgi:hypothetical protein
MIPNPNQLVHFLVHYTKLLIFLLVVFSGFLNFHDFEVYFRYLISNSFLTLQYIGSSHQSKY